MPLGGALAARTCITFPLAGAGNGCESLHPADRTVYLVASYVAAVNNGGHASFFYNSHGEFAHETVEALLDH